jgi:hypothetical protein
VRRRREWILACTCSAAFACGDNTVPIGPPFAHGDTLFLAAHPDDDMIFMQPELSRRLREGSSTTIYATTAGPSGVNRALLEAAKVAYGAAAGSSAWECGQVPIGTITAWHCRLTDRPISLVDLGLPDGGIPGDRQDSLLHLIDGTVTSLSAFEGGSVTSGSVVELFASIFDATTPDALESLELAGSHGRDHSSHMFVASIGLWAAARVGYAGPATWHRGYNVDVEDPTLVGDDLAEARTMLGYYEACADRCGPCGASCPSLLAAHETWLARQYSTERVRAAAGKLALGDRCLDASLSLGDCATAPQVELEPAGALRFADRCVATAETGELTLAPCTGGSEQYWVLDSEGALWSGRPPERAPDMHYDHVRCLAEQGTSTCGAGLQVHWRILP